MLEIIELVEPFHTTLILSGQLDFSSRKIFRDAIQQAQSSHPAEIILNFRDVRYIDSTGLGLLMLMKKTLWNPSCQIRVVVSQGFVMDIFHMTGMENLFPMTVVNGGSTSTTVLIQDDAHSPSRSMRSLQNC